MHPPNSRHHALGHLMCQATETLLWPAGTGGRGAPLRCRVGSGLATYHRFHKALQQHRITYGVRMVAEKFNPDSARHWLSAREILSRGYFQGEVSVLNLLAHTCCHEFAHLLQHQAGHRHYRSVHNRAFYQWLDQLHERGEGLRVREFLAEEAARRSLTLPAEPLALTPPETQAKRWQTGEAVAFRNGQVLCRGQIIRVNRKTCTVQGSGPWRGRRYRVPFSLLETSPG